MPEAFHITRTGVTIAYSATSASAALPVTSSGDLPRFVRVVVSNGQACVRAGVSGVVAVNTDAMVQPSDSLTLCVTGATHIAAVALASSSGTVQISPLENQY
jgi:hypothetical protein